MALEISGKVKQYFPNRPEPVKNGQWLRQDFVIETQEQYPRKVCFSAWGDKSIHGKSIKAGCVG